MRIHHWDHGGCGAMSFMFKSLSAAAKHLKKHGYTVEWNVNRSEFNYFDEDGTEIGGFYRGK